MDSLTSLFIMVLMVVGFEVFSLIGSAFSVLDLHLLPVEPEIERGVVCIHIDGLKSRGVS